MTNIEYDTQETNILCKLILKLTIEPKNNGPRKFIIT